MKRYIFAFIILVLYFGGLNSVRELGDLAIVKAVSIDKREDGKYEISAIVIDTKDKENKDKGIMITSVGDSVHMAARDMVDISSKKLYIAHMETLIISEKIAQEDLENTLDFFIRDNEGSNSFFLFIAKDVKASECLEKINEEEIDLVSFLKSTQKYKGNANLKTLNEIVKILLEKGRALCVNAVTIKDNIEINDMAYFDGYNLIGYLTEEESIMYNILINEVDNVLLSVNEGDDLVVAELISPKTKMKLKDNTINIEVNSVIHITQMGKNIKIDDIEKKNTIENLIASNVKEKILKLYNSKSAEGIDVLGIGNLLYRKKSKLLTDNYLDKIKINIDVKLNIVNTGGIKKAW